jgi:hypothetical protein
MSSSTIPIVLSGFSLAIALLSLGLGITNTVLARQDRRLRARELRVEIKRDHDDQWLILVRNFSAEDVVIDSYGVSLFDRRVKQIGNPGAPSASAQPFVDRYLARTLNRGRYIQPKRGWRDRLNGTGENLPFTVHGFGKEILTAAVSDPAAVWVQAAVETALGDRFYSSLVPTMKLTVLTRARLMISLCL